MLLTAFLLKIYDPHTCGVFCLSAWQLDSCHQSSCNNSSGLSLLDSIQTTDFPKLRCIYVKVLCQNSQCGSDFMTFPKQSEVKYGEYPSPETQARSLAVFWVGVSCQVYFLLAILPFSWSLGLGKLWHGRCWPALYTRWQCLDMLIDWKAKVNNLSPICPKWQSTDWPMRCKYILGA